MADVAELIRADLTLSGHQLHIEVQPGLSVNTIPAALTEALIRIFANVRDHALCEGCNDGRGDGWLGCLQICAQSSGTHVCIEVSDNGVGIAPEHLNQVFNPFFITQRGARGHVGLGLTVAHSHVTQRLQGRIEIKSQPGQGTWVMIYLPL